jgi:hypothetical protein
MALPVSAHDYFHLPPNYNYTIPKYSSFLLEKLKEKRGFTNEVFNKVHQNGGESTIDSWIRSYRERASEFRHDYPGAHPDTQQRLEIILNASAAFEDPSEEVFFLLAKAAAVAVPEKHEGYEPDNPGRTLC